MKKVLALVFWLSATSLGFSQVVPVFPSSTPAPAAYLPKASEPLVVAPAAAPAAAAPAAAPAAAALPASGPSLLQSLTDGTFLAEMLMIFGAMLAFLRGLAEALTRLSTRFPGVSKSAQAVSSAAWILGAFIGKWGHGEPVLVSQEKAKAFAEKGVFHAGPATSVEPPKAG